MLKGQFNEVASILDAPSTARAKSASRPSGRLKEQFNEVSAGMLKGHFNEVSSILDAGTVYGNSQERFEALR